MRRFFRYRLSFKVFLSFILIISITAFGALLIGYQLIRSTVEHEITLRLSDSLSAYFQEIRFTEEDCLRIAEELCKDDEIINLLHANSLAALERKLIHYYELGIFDIIEIENSEGKILLRGHHPAVASDINLSYASILLR